MSTAASSSHPQDFVEKRDAYALDPEVIQDPPTRWGASLRFLGPGMITSAAVVGSGELLTATALGAQAGFVLFWLVFVSTAVKVGIQIELARWSISTGKAAVSGYDQVPPRVAGRGWMSWLVLFMFLEFIISQAGVLGGSALALSMLLPIGGDPFAAVSIGAWVSILAIVAAAIHITNRYTLVERISTVLVIIVTVFAVGMVFGVQVTPFAWSGADLAGGLQFQLAVGGMGIALAMFGMTGVGAGEITAYTYWCVEKGYASWSGANDGSEAWKRRARGWIAVMKKDAWLSWFIYTVSTAAFYILGAAVLHPQGLVPEGAQVIEVISTIFSSTLGETAGVLFILGAALALFKTIVANAPSLGRQACNTLAEFGVFNWQDPKARDRWMRITMMGLLASWAILAAVVQSPLLLVIIAGVLNSIYLMGVVVATLYLMRTQTDPAVKGGPVWTVYLVISGLAVFGVGVLALVSELGA